MRATAATLVEKQCSKARRWRGSQSICSSEASLAEAKRQNQLAEVKAAAKLLAAALLPEVSGSQSVSSMCAAMADGVELAMEPLWSEQPPLLQRAS